MGLSEIDPSRALPSRMTPVAARLIAAGASASSLPALLRSISRRVETAPAKAQLQREDEAQPRPRYLLSGWACRYTELADGRRQIYDVILPGEGMGVCLQPRPLALTSVVALTPVQLVDASELTRSDVLEPRPDLLNALNLIADGDERRMLVQVTRLGRMSALERLADLLIQLHDRLAEIGAVDHQTFALPLTQELLGDLLGLSTVHLNRTLQHLRKQGLIATDRGRVQLLDRAALERLLPTPSRRAVA